VARIDHKARARCVRRDEPCPEHAVEVALPWPSRAMRAPRVAIPDDQARGPADRGRRGRRPRTAWAKRSATDPYRPSSPATRRRRGRCSWP
jgi:hypothetical protein